MIHEPETLDRVSEDLLWDLLTVNMASVTMLTRKILPQMIGRRKGAIVNLGSSSELQPLPNLTVYAASKKFMTFFSKALEAEVAEHNIHVQLVMPGFVRTNMNAYADHVLHGGLLFPNAYTYARSAVFTLGKTSETNGFWTHAVQVCIHKLQRSPKTQQVKSIYIFLGNLNNVIVGFFGHLFLCVCQCQTIITIACNYNDSGFWSIGEAKSG